MFLVSILLILCSSYFILFLLLRYLDSESGGRLSYFLLIAFSQIILSFEFLSLFNMISKNNFLICNSVVFIISLISVLTFGGSVFQEDFEALIKNIMFQLRKSKVFIFLFSCFISFTAVMAILLTPIFGLDGIMERKKIRFALKTDKLLLFLYVCLILFLIFQLIAALFFPVTFGDALTYYLPRCTAWIQNGTINHFITPDSRELIMPVNMEFLYTWLLLFTKSEQGCAVFSYIGYIGAIYVLYNFLKETGFSVRRRLWSVFVFSSFALVGIEMYTPCADLFTGALILNGIWLFLRAVKMGTNIDFYFSALSFALSLGVKTTAFICMPAVFTVLAIITFLYKKEKCINYIVMFCLVFAVNFLIFSSYNYILNYIYFANPFSCPEQFLLNKFRGGFQAFAANFIKYSFAVFDISGIKDLINYNGFITHLQTLALNAAGVTDKSFTSPYFRRYFYFNSDMSIVNSALGIMGLFAFLPSLIKSFKKFLKNKFSKRNALTAALALSLIMNLVIFSGVMVFTQFNMRYLLTFAVISSPVLVYSYIKSNKNLFKLLLCWFMFVYFIIIAHKAPAGFIVSYIKYKCGASQNQSVHFLLSKSEETDIYKYIKNQNKKNIALITSQVNTPNYYIEKLKLDGFYMKKLLPENIENYDLSKYDYIITAKDKSSSTNIVNFEERMKSPPEFFVNECIYFDYDQKPINSINIPPAMVKCEIPFKYFEEKGFKIDENINLKNYKILKKIH